MISPTDLTPEQWRGMDKSHILSTVLDSAGDNLVLAETGRIRSLVGGEGFSTIVFANGKNVYKFYSIDANTTTGIMARSLIPPQLWDKPQDPKVTFIDMEAIAGIAKLKEMLPVNSIDIFLFDSANNAAQTMNEFVAAEPLLKNDSIIIIDDVYNGGVKGDTLVPFLKNAGHQMDKWKDYAVIHYQRR